MIGNLLGMVVRSALTASVTARENSGPPLRRAYYGWGIKTVVAIPVLMFAFFFVVSLTTLGNGSENGILFVLITLGCTVTLGGILGHTYIKRTAEWDDTGVKFRWLTGQADLKWSDIERVEMRRGRKDFARIRFRDGRTFGMSVYFIGGNTLLRELARHGVPACKWGTSEPLEMPRKAV